MSDGRIVPAPRRPGRDAPVTAMAFLTDEDSCREVRSCLLDMGVIGALVERGDVATAIGRLSQGPSPELLIVDLSGQPEPLSKIEQLLMVCAPSTSIVVADERDDGAFCRDLQQAGVADYFAKPLTAKMLAKSLSVAIAGVGEAAQPRAGRLIVAFGVHAGSGASTFAANIAWSLAEERRQRAVLLDLNLKDGDAARLLDAEPGDGLREALQHPERIDRRFLARAVARVGERLDLLATRQPMEDPFVPGESAVLDLIAELRAEYPCVIVDAPPWCDDLYFRMMKLPGAVLAAVAEPTLLGARGINRWQAQLPITDQAFWRVLNKTGAPGALSKDDIAHAVGAPPDMVIPFEPQIADAAFSGLATAGRGEGMLRALTPLLDSLEPRVGRASPPREQRALGG